MATTVFLGLSVLFIGALYYFMFLANKGKGQQSAKQEKEQDQPEVVQQGRRGAANRLRNRNRNQQQAASDNEEEKKFEQWAQDNDNQEVQNVNGQDFPMPAGDRRMTKKEMQRHEKMQQRRQQREAMAQQREMDNKTKSEKEARQEEAERRREERDRQIEAEEQRIEDEKKRKEQAEFEQWKALMQVEETGKDKSDNAEDELVIADKLIEYIERRKVVMLEDVAAEFKMLTKEIVSRINQLEKDGRLLGITDDRGKYIHITREEFESVAGYITDKGRVSRADLFQEANRLVRLTPTEQDKELIKQEQMSVLSQVEKSITSDQK